MTYFTYKKSYYQPSTVVTGDTDVSAFKLKRFSWKAPRARQLPTGCPKYNKKQKTIKLVLQDRNCKI
ncbi:hypothetical protein C0J52_27471 [Blattella germanica]|nr:hypothetical protein C0J52_27471 [Blattella germanica]